MGIWWGWKDSNLLNFWSTDLQSAVPRHLHRIPVAGMFNNASLYWSYSMTLSLNWSVRQDSNLRPRVPKTRALPLRYAQR